MEFMYMDESGKNILTQQGQELFVFGGLIINRDKVFDALQAYKATFKANREAVRNCLNKNITTSDKGQRIQKMMEKFEFHAVKIFNPNKENKRKGKIIEENPWKYYPANDRFRLVHDVFINIAPFITKVIIFKVEKMDFLQYCAQNGLTPTDDLINELMVEFIINEYQDWLHTNDRKGTIITDRLDSSIRDIFVQKIKSANHNQYWTEPVTVESHLNAFTQIIDILTYCYYMIKTNAVHKDNFKAIKKVYDTYIKRISEEADLINFMSGKSIKAHHK